MTFPTVIIPQADIVEVLITETTIEVNDKAGCLFRILKARGVVVNYLGDTTLFANLERTTRQ